MTRGIFSMPRAARRDPLAFLTDLAAEGAPQVSLRFGPVGTHLLVAPELIRDVLLDTELYTKETRDHRRLRDVLGQGLLTSGGALWRRQRRALQPLFRPERGEAHQAEIEDELEALVRDWDAAATSGSVVNVGNDLLRFGLRTASRSFLGCSPGDRDQELADALEVVLRHVHGNLFAILPLPAWIPTPRNRRLGRALKTLEDFGAEASRAAVPEMLPAALKALVPGPGDPPVNATLLRDEVFTLLASGAETTAVALTWAFALLATEPTRAASLGGPTPEAGQARGAFCREVLRLFPPVWCLTRRAERAHQLGDAEVGAGDVVILSPWVTHRSPTVWMEPLRFDPGRFAAGTALPHPSAWFPFGGGPRGCVGANFAMTEMTTALERLVGRFEVNPVAPGLPEPVPMVTIRARGGLPARVTRRS